jgi:chloramphenicol-sensitive protein RarD
MLRFPIALGFVIMREADGSGSMTRGGWTQLLLLSCAGPVTAMPLLLFGAGVRRIALSTAGFLQYIAPSIMFVMSVFYWHEPFDRNTLVSFVCIWSALVLYTGEGLWVAKMRTGPELSEDQR